MPVEAPAVLLLFFLGLTQTLEIDGPSTSKRLFPPPQISGLCLGLTHTKERKVSLPTELKTAGT